MDQDRMNRQGQAAVARRPRHLALAIFAALALALSAVLLATGADTGLKTGSASAATKKQLITGKLSKPGYTVIALASSGRAKTVRAPSGAFKLRPPAEKVTLHLRASDGTYAGPIVVAGTWNLVKVAKNKLRRTERKLKKAKARLSKASGKKAIRRAKRRVRAATKEVKQARSDLKKARRWAGGKEVVLGVEAGAELGTVSVRATAGYALAKLRLNQWNRWAVEENRARARNGVPIGAGNFGRVRSKNTHGGAPGDLDLDGVADPLDIDDDGDLVLDNLDSKQRQGSKSGALAQAPVRSSGIASGDFALKTVQSSTLDGTVNANAGLTDDQIKDALPNNAFMFISVLPGDSAELDCGQPQGSAEPGLVYCTTGGTGAIRDASVGAFLPFPDCCDPDADGFGTLTPGLDGLNMVLTPGATIDQIGSGDVMIQRVTTDGLETQFVATLQYIFATNPTLASYDDGQGNSATLSYPVEGGEPGTRENPFPVKAAPSGDVELTLTLWRPQRRAIPPETAEWIDIGGLNYVATVSTMNPGTYTCEQGAYSSSDPDLSPVARDPDWEADFRSGGGFTDLAADRPASPDNTFTYGVNLTDCLESKGLSFDAGETREFSFSAFADPDPGRGADQAATRIYFKR